MRTRRVIPKIWYESKDISEELSRYLLGFTYEDVEHGEADTIELQLDDREGVWMQDWFPDQGAKLTARLLCENWYGEGERVELVCGTFVIDKIEASGPPKTVSIGAQSADITQSMRREQRTHAWEEASLKTVAADIAKRHKLQLVFEADNVQLGRVDQKETSDLRLLVSLCEDYALSVKITTGQLLIADPARLIKRVSGTIEQGSADQSTELSSYRFHDAAYRAYKGCMVICWDMVTGEEIRHLVTDPAVPSGETLRLNVDADTTGQAIAKAKAALKSENRGLRGGSITTMGRPELVAGTGVVISGFGKFDDTYLITRSAHRFNPGTGYVTTINFERV